MTEVERKELHSRLEAQYANHNPFANRAVLRDYFILTSRSSKVWMAEITRETN